MVVLPIVIAEMTKCVLKKFAHLVEHVTSVVMVLTELVGIVVKDIHYTKKVIVLLLVNILHQCRRNLTFHLSGGAGDLGKIAPGL